MPPITEAKALPTTKEKTPPAERPIKWPEPVIEVHYEGTELGPCPVSKLKEIIGWEEDTAEVPFTKGYVEEIKLLTGRRVRLNNDTMNRPIRPEDLRTIKQDILRKKWKRNGHALIIGQTGQTIECQHRIIAACLAEDERTHPKTSMHWAENWPGEITIETIIVYGIEEDDDTFATFNTSVPATFADVLYRSPVFRSMKGDKRKQASKLLDWCIKTLWDRTGAKDDAFAPRRTHGEAMDFLARHGGDSGRIVQAVRHVIEEYGIGKGGEDDHVRRCRSYCPPGTAAALMYLMAASNTDDAYLAEEASNRTEKLVDLTRWARAKEFWVQLALGVKGELKQLHYAMKALYGENDELSPSMGEKLTLLSKAWAVFSEEGQKVTEDDLVFETQTDEFGEVSNVVKHNFGGIDKEKSAKKPKAEAADGATTETTPEPSAKAKEIAARIMAGRGNGSMRAPDEVAKPEARPTDKDGKPPAPPLKRETRKDVEARQTAEAKKADEAAAKGGKGGGKKQPLRPGNSSK